ncbi:MAG: reactive intermediate/imine deaminase [Candidatus Solibacter sp.]|nr:reactive intermediate/imine deaminase [Candidatus Solibacter sp.]
MAYMSRQRTILCTLALALAGNLIAADKKAVVPAGVAIGGPYTPGIIAGDTLHVAGQVGRIPGTNNYPESFEDEVKYTLDNVAAIMKEAGYGFQDAVAVQVYLTDMELFQRMNAVYMKYFPEPRPARTTVGIAKLVGPARIEITVTAYKQGGGAKAAKPARK